MDDDALYSFTTEGSMADDLLSPQSLKKIFVEKLAPKKIRPGIDRVSAETFARQIDDSVELLSRKLRDGTYTFSPYLQILKAKGAGKAPRVIALPTVRDRIALSALKELLHATFNECVNRLIPNAYVKPIAASLSALSINDDTFVRVDIKNFYDEIDHLQLRDRLAPRLDDRHLQLILRAVTTPSVTHHYKMLGGSARRSKGVPQGTALSNILAEIYLMELDSSLSDVTYHRYVDDILVLCRRDHAAAVADRITEMLKSRGLDVNTEKTVGADGRQSLQKPFEYLGYEYLAPTMRIRPRRQSLQRFLDSLAADFARFRSSLTAHSTRDIATRARVFIEDINIRLTGAIDGTRRYGWVFYFIEINDMSVLFQIDRLVHELFSRSSLPKLTSIALKRTVRAFHEARFQRNGTYIMNYNRPLPLLAQLSYARDRGFLSDDPNRQYSEAEIVAAFMRAKHSQLTRLERDVGLTS